MTIADENIFTTSLRRKKDESVKPQDGAAQILYECAALLERKGRDYNSGGINRDDYYIYGRKSLMTIIHGKYMRLRSLTETEDTPNFESIEDTLKDLANYCAIFADWERRNANK
jgi:hypothetical protein